MAASNQYEVFDVDKLAKLVGNHKDTFQKLHSVEIALGRRFHEMEHASEALVLAAACGEPLLFIGPPGTGKSLFIRSFCDLVGLKASKKAKSNGSEGSSSKVIDYFEYLLTPFTEPGELFGHYNIVLAQHDKKLVRDEVGMMQQAKVVYLDEVFNGSSAILNSLLSFIQEKRFHDRGGWQPVELQCLFAATNDIPAQPELRAVYDRFTFRCWIDNIADYATSAFSRPLLSLLEKGWLETYGRPDGDKDDQSLTRDIITPTFPGLLDKLAVFRQDLRGLVDPYNERNVSGRSISNLPVRPVENFFGMLAQDVSRSTQKNLGRMSNRRLVRLLYAMLVHRIYRTANGKSDAQPYLTDDDFRILVYFLDRRDRQNEQQMRFTELRQ